MAPVAAVLDRTRDGVPSLIASTEPGQRHVDLHLHSTASDGEYPPEVVVRRAAEAGLTAMALTDHDTLAGLPAAQAAGAQLGIRVVPGCEFSVAVAWGEMHLLGYFLPLDAVPLQQFLVRCREDRSTRGARMVERLQALGVAIELEHVLQEAAGGAVGRPHVARALVRLGAALDLDEAFGKFIGRGRPAFVAKNLPTLRTVADLVHSVGGLVSAAHLKERGTRATLEQLQRDGLDAVETRHPSHDPDLRAMLTGHALALGLKRTGGSDWHGELPFGHQHGGLGSERVPLEWLEELEAARPRPTTTSPS